MLNGTITKHFNYLLIDPIIQFDAIKLVPLHNLSQLRISKFHSLSAMNIIFILANRLDPDEIPDSYVISSGHSQFDNISSVYFKHTLRISKFYCIIFLYRIKIQNSVNKINFQVNNIDIGDTGERTEKTLNLIFA